MTPCIGSNIQVKNGYIPKDQLLTAGSVNFHKKVQDNVSLVQKTVAKEVDNGSMRPNGDANSLIEIIIVSLHKEKNTPTCLMVELYTYCAMKMQCVGVQNRKKKII